MLLIKFFIYNWSVPSGWIFNSGQNTNVIDVTANYNSGFVTVTPYNDCGDGQSSNIYVEICHKTIISYFR
ncbi:MAG TPA: hypothetical protein PKJ07_06700 [Bacteroidales bacterium]|nr:hypothetical protein [Bacteroidales bacterium]HOB27813.1 hypothetical protein [Bacteroidales bacterium]